jgi:hypothetical protein
MFIYARSRPFRIALHKYLWNRATRRPKLLLKFLHLSVQVV